MNLKTITTGDIKISVLVAKADGAKALRAVHQAFHLEQSKAGASGSSGFQARPASLSPTNGHRDLASLTLRLASMEDILVSDVFLATDQGRITIFDLPDQPGNCSRVFQAVAEGGIVVDMIVQNVSGPGRAQLSFSVPEADLNRGLELTRRVVSTIDAGVQVAADAAIARLFVLGVGMRTHTGVARRMFGALAERGINISMINTSEVRISVVVDRARGAEALLALKDAFGVK